MSHATPGFQKIPRQDNLFQERVHDAYKARAKLPEPSVCSQCGVVFIRDAGSGCWPRQMRIRKPALPVIASTTITPPVFCT